jgi:hypothetical protein
MSKLKFRSRILITFSLSVAIGTVSLFISNDAMAGSRRCQRYSDDTSVCINEKGFKTYCRTERGDGYDGKKDVCVGKGNYRKECISSTEWIFGCIDSKGIKSRCEISRNFDTYVSYCEKSDGTKSKCVSYNNGVSTCTDIDKKGNPI